MIAGAQSRMARRGLDDLGRLQSAAGRPMRVAGKLGPEPGSRVQWDMDAKGNRTATICEGERA